MTTVLAKLFLKGVDTTSASGRKQVGNLAGIVGIVCNLFLFVVKFFLGIFSGSMAIAADAFNNLSDAGSSVVSLLGFWLGSQKADEEHPFGHARYEYLAGMTVCVMILAIGLNLAKEGIVKILHPTMPKFSSLVLVIMLISIVIKLWLSLFNRKLGNLIQSDTLKATAADARNDCFSTGAVLLSTILCQIFQIEVIDGIVAVAMAIFIIYSGFDLLRDALDSLLGHRPSEELVKLIEKTVLNYPEVIGMHDLLVHDYGPGNQFASLHIEFPAEKSALEAHDIIDNIEREFVEKYRLQVVIHYDPIVTSDHEVGELRAYISEEVMAYDEKLSIHDLRIVPGDSHINVLFDLVLPAGYQGNQEKVLHYIEQRVKDKNQKYICVVKVEQNYT